MRRVIIMGAAGRDFHNFNVFFRKNKDFKVVCFTATQIPNIAGRKYPKELAGKRYPRGIPILPESKLTDSIKKFKADIVVFSYSDISHNYVMHKAKSRKKIVSICASRTGAGKSQTTRLICDILQAEGVRFSAIRHPMPYGDLKKQAVQMFSKMADLDRHKCTIEEREEYEPHVRRGNTIFAGLAYRCR
jgi:predicted GTPase